mmetsp:Transcript_22147/g.52626  ORF Transcript_22147/g.52626 Transcript_22147/m.52626 type:complete len:215 (-) Transcript_22147:871-1515(-)
MMLRRRWRRQQRRRGLGKTGTRHQICHRKSCRPVVSSLTSVSQTRLELWDGPNVSLVLQASMTTPVKCSRTSFSHVLTRKVDLISSDFRKATDCCWMLRTMMLRRRWEEEAWAWAEAWVVEWAGSRVVEWPGAVKWAVGFPTMWQWLWQSVDWYSTVSTTPKRQHLNKQRHISPQTNSLKFCAIVCCSLYTEVHTYLPRWACCCEYSRPALSAS